MAVVTISLGFMPARLVAASLSAHEATFTRGLSHRHVVLDQHYPIDKEANRAALRTLAAAHGIEVMDAGRNLGLHDGFNYVLNQLALADNDVVIAYDLDSKPISVGWDQALVRAIEGDPEQRIAWSSLLNPRCEKDLRERGFYERVIDGYLRVWIARTAVTNSVCAWRMGWLRKVGLLTEPRPWYGHLESAMWEKLGSNQWAFLPQWIDVDDLRDMHDRAYVVYKWQLSHEMKTDLDFESWLKANEYDLETGKPKSAAHADAPQFLP